ncbi:MAG: PKD domain-containing protein [Sphingobacteriales bacterium]|nr:PKD domain-containing protein [Sphingobacteriales bacterium]
MKKYIFYSLCLLLLWSSQFVAAQSLRPVARQISTLKESGALPKVTPFSPYIATPPDVSAMVSQATFLQLNQVALEDLLQQSPYGLELTLPTTSGKPLVLELFRANPLAEEFLSTERTAYGERNVPYKAGLYYRGIVKGNDNSMAAISFFANGQVIGVMATVEDGNMVLGNVGNSKALVFYYEKDLLIKNNFDCGSDDNTFGQGGAFPLLPAFEKSADCEAAICKTVNIYFECDNKMYLDNGSNTTNVNNYVSGFFNAVATIYQNDNMTVAISEIYVWTTADTYPSTSSSAVLNQFSSNVSTFNGDLAHLLSTESNGHGGIAWLDALCGDVYYRHAYSNISNSYQNFPTYSWTVMVVAHETGHNVASPHTHSCCWPGGAIDNCYTTETCGTTTCSGGPAPTNGGTVMSYCHLTSYGINLNNGFGVLPGTLMRDRVCAVSCLNTTGAIATANFTYNFTDLTVSFINTSTNATSFNWNFGDGNISTDASPTHTYTANGTYTVILETCTTDCGCSTKSLNITVATGTSGNGPCSGNLPLTACTGTITDGSGSANYGDMWNCSWAIETDSGTVIALTFTTFDTEASYDFVRVYNGIDASAPLLGSYSGTSLPPTLISSSNQMYISFTSDPYVNATGWSANYACSSAGYCTLQGTDATYEWIDSYK